MLAAFGIDMNLFLVVRNTSIGHQSADVLA